MKTTRDLPSTPSKETESNPSTTQSDKNDSRGVFGAGKGIDEVDSRLDEFIHSIRASDDESISDLAKAWPEISKPPDAGAHEQEAHAAEGQVWEISQEGTSEMAERYRDARIRESVALLMTELPGLLEDREKLRKLREVLG